MRIITLQDLLQHIFDLWGKADGIEWAEPGFDAVAKHDTGTIRIHPITSEAAYATALHEIGHLRQGMHEDVLVNERRAWEWARANALVWTPTMELEAERSLGQYEADFEDEAHRKEYYHEQMLAFVSDLLIGDRPDGLEVCDALVRNAVELALMYEMYEDEARRVLLGLVDKYLR
jgi:hypothetical protein